MLRRVEISKPRGQDGPEARPSISRRFTVDLFATLVELFGVEVAQRTHGRSLLPLIRGDVEPVREIVLSGVWGREVHLIDHSFKYARAPAGANAPLSLWSNRWSTMPVPFMPKLRLPPPDERALLDKMPGSRVPVIRQPFREGDLLPYWALGPFSGNHLYDLRNDPEEENNLTGSNREKDYANRLRQALKELEAPGDQMTRLGLD